MADPQSVPCSPTGTFTMHAADGRVLGEYEYSNMRITVQDSFECSDEPVAFELKKGPFLPVDEVGASEWRQPIEQTASKPPRVGHTAMIEAAISYLRDPYGRRQ